MNSAAAPIHKKECNAFLIAVCPLKIERVIDNIATIERLSGGIVVAEVAQVEQGSFCLENDGVRLRSRIVHVFFHCYVE